MKFHSFRQMMKVDRLHDDSLPFTYEIREPEEAKGISWGSTALVRGRTGLVALLVKCSFPLSLKCLQEPYIFDFNQGIDISVCFTIRI